MKTNKFTSWTLFIVLIVLVITAVLFQIRTLRALQKQERDDIIQKAIVSLERLTTIIRDELLSIPLYFSTDLPSYTSILDNFNQRYLSYKVNSPYPDLIERFFHIELNREKPPVISRYDSTLGYFLPVFSGYNPFLATRFMEYLYNESNITMLMVDPETILILWPYRPQNLLVFSVSVAYIEKNLLPQIAKEYLAPLRYYDFAFFNRNDALLYMTGDDIRQVKPFITLDCNLFGPVNPYEHQIPGPIQLPSISRQGGMSTPNYFREMRRLRNFPVPRPPQAFMINNTEWKVQVLYKHSPLLTILFAPSSVNLFLTVFILILLTTAFIYTVNSNKRYASLQTEQRLFINSVTHELKTPLASFIGAGDNLASGLVNNSDELITYGKLIKDEAKRLQTIIDSLLVFSGISTKQLQLETVVMESQELFETAFSKFKNSFIEKGFVIEYSPKPPHMLISGNHGLLVTMFENIFRNVLAHADTGKFVGYGVYNAVIKSKSYCAFWIQDKGDGIPRNECKKIFLPFYRGNKARNKQIQGMGIGLYTVSKIADLHHGFTECNSRRGVGTTFTVYLPEYKHHQEGITE